MSGFQGFGCCSALFNALIRRADIQPSTTTPGALGIKGLHTDFSEGRGEGGGGEIFERWATLKETILRKNRGTEQEDAGYSGRNGGKRREKRRREKQAKERPDTSARETLTASGAQRSRGRERQSKG